MSIFVIAEIGINHNGDINIAKQLIDVAKESGADAVKFQKRDINLVYSKELLDSYRESPWGNTQRQQKEGLEFSKEEYEEINSYCNSKGIEWFASAWDLNSLKFLDNFNCQYAKVASAMIVDKTFLNEVASRGKYTFISTALSSMDIIKDAVEIFRSKNCPFELMHCVGTYPMKDENANLKCIQTLRDAFNCKVGYSGHEVGLSISYAAAALGATSIERHITLSRAMYGSDQAASVEPPAFKQMVGAIRKIELALGDGIKRILPEEEEVAKKLRAHILN